MTAPNIRICRVYSPPDYKEGLWILVDRLWPRGIKKERMDFDLWLKEIAPSPALRQWFNHEPGKWDEFKKRYFEELQSKEELMQDLQEKAKHSPLTLFYAAKDIQHNHALLLQAALISWPHRP